VIHPGPYAHLGELLADALVQFKSETALIEVSRKREVHRWTFLDVRRLAHRVARRLEAEGIGPDDRVAIAMSNQSRWLVTATAVFLRGAVLVPLDHKLGAEEQAALLAHCRPRLLVTEEGLWRRFRARPEVPSVWVTDAPAGADLRGAAHWDALPEDDAPPPPVTRTREDIAAIVYSSGTGGAPKGCMLPHGAYLSQLDALLELFPMGRGDRYFSILPTNHAIDFMVGFVGPFACGATVVHQRTLRPEFLGSTLRAYQITHMAVVPLLLEAFERNIRQKLDEQEGWRKTAFDGLVALNRRLTDARPRHALSSKLLRPVHDAFGGHLKLLFAGGAWVDPERVRFLYELGLPVVVGYGLTEACTVCTVNRLDPFRPDSVGRAVRGTELRLADFGPDGVGEVQVRGPTLMRGYLDDPEQSAAAMTPDGWLRTGDLGWFDAAFHLHLVGRAKNMIVTPGGKNIYPEDIEAAFDGLPADELCVFAANYVWPRRGLGDEALIAVVRAAEPDRALADLRARNLRLPDFKRVSGVLWWAEDFPRTASMKVKRGELAARLREGAEPGAVRPLSA
jgi:long-chain acyl-CoA synthetase